MSAHGVILVTGGTGNLGRRVVAGLHDTGRDVRVLSRSTHDATAGVEYVTGDLTKDEGVTAAVAGADVVVHCAATGKRKPDVAQIEHLVRAARHAGVRHVLNISVVGAERIPVDGIVDRAMFGYFAGQRAVEQAVAASGLGWTNLRATQFHDGFILLMVRGMARLPLVPVPSGFRFQPVDTAEVAARVVELTLAAPAGQVADLGGPKVYSAGYLVRTYLEAVDTHRRLVRVAIPGAAARAIRSGANLTPDGMLGRRTWEEFLAEMASSRARAARVPGEAAV